MNRDRTGKTVNGQLPPGADLDRLEDQARRLQRAHRSASPFVVDRLRRHLRRFTGASDHEIRSAPLPLRDARQVIARELGFRGWSALERRAGTKGDDSRNPRAEVGTRLGPYERQAADLHARRPEGCLDQARYDVARRHGFPTWWRLVAAVDRARQAALPVRACPADPGWDLKREARDLLRAARRGDPAALQRFRDSLLPFAETPDDELAAAVVLRQARYVLEAEYGGGDPSAQRETPAQVRAWRERLWASHDRRASSRRTRAQMSPRERAFVEAAMGDWRRPHRASLPRLRVLGAEDPSPIAAAGPAALAMALAWEGGEPIVRFLLEQGARLDHEPGTFGPMDGAVWTGCLESVRLLLKAGGAPDPAEAAVEPPHGGLASHRTPLHTAAWLAQPEMTEVLLEHGAARTIEARLGEDGSTPLQRAVLANNWPTADPWARRDPNGRSNHRSGREVAALLLEYGARYDIWSACGLEDAWRVEQLLREDPALVRAGDPSGFTPLHWAAKQGALDCSRLLLDADADVNADSNSLKTPLHQAAVAHQNMVLLPSNVDLMALLIEAGADVDARDSKGRTPLFLACQGGYDLNAEYLILLGARTTIRNHKGKSPLDVAAKGCRYLKGGRRGI